MKKIILAIIGILAVAGIAIIVMRSNGKPQTASNARVYCTSDGTFTSTMPIQSHRSYCVKSDSADKTYSPNTPAEYSFSIVDDQGNTLKDFAITHTKIMHVIVVRTDLAYFQHVHPDFDQSTGKFTLSGLTFPADGTYRIFADFAPSGTQMDAMGMPLTVTSFEEVLVGNIGDYLPQPLGSQERTKTFGNYQVVLSSDKTLVSGADSILTFSLKQNGKPITDLQAYLGELGHSIILREENLDFIHAHPLEDVNKPQTGKVNFMVNFPEPGIYKVFTQFQKNGTVFTTDFVVIVSQPTNSTDTMPGMDMKMP